MGVGNLPENLAPGWNQTTLGTYKLGVRNPPDLMEEDIARICQKGTLVIALGGGSNLELKHLISINS